MLVVDDEETNRELLRDLMEGQGHQMTEAEYVNRLPELLGRLASKNVTKT